MDRWSTGSTRFGACGRTILERFPLRVGESPASPIRVVVAALVRNGLMLLGLRNATRASFPGVWDLPGGHVEKGETLRGALRRELHEELGIDATVGAPATRVTADGAEMTVWRITEWNGDVTNRAPTEHDQLGWFGPDEIDGLTLAHPSYPALLTQLGSDPPGS